jgi:licheninase
MPFCSRLLLVLGLLATVPLVGCNYTSSSPVEDPPEPPPADEPSWTLVWADEFDGNGRPDTSKWTYETGGHGWGNQELQYYTERTENARVEDGHLVIEARREDYQGNDYTSARMNSAASWTYGRFEIRAKLPSGRGTWPAIWMLASQEQYGDQYWPDNGEIDIMEHVGFDPDVVHATVHTEAYNHMQGTQRGNSIRVDSARTAFNVYAVEWTPTMIRAFVNGQQYFLFERAPGATYRRWPFDQDFHLLLNIAVGGSWGGAEGGDSTIWPQQMVIDYVRVYERTD